MLYPQSELISLYVKLYILFLNERYKRIILDTLEETNKRLSYQELYFSASDTDSNNGEGRYFIHSYEQTINTLKKENIINIDEVLEYLDITEIPNFDAEFSNVYLNTNFIFYKTLVKQAEKSVKTLLEKVYIKGTLYHGFLLGYELIDDAVFEDYLYLAGLLQTSYR